MPGRDWTRAAIILIASLAYWDCIARFSGVGEPWDAGAYWTVAYPISIILAGIVGWHIRRHAWAIGMAMSLTQLPVMAAHSGAAVNWAIALAFLLPLSIPHGAAAFASNQYRRRRPR